MTLMVMHHTIEQGIALIYNNVFDRMWGPSRTLSLVSPGWNALIQMVIE
jgi:hypothetical protein